MGDDGDGSRNQPGKRKQEERDTKRGKLMKKESHIIPNPPLKRKKKKSLEREEMKIISHLEDRVKNVRCI